MIKQTELPRDFVLLMHEHYDSATADALCSALCTTEPEVSVRLNPRKLSADEVLACRPNLEPVPWCPNAFYLPDRPTFTFDPLLHAGAYYVQEASSMAIATLLLPREGDNLLPKETSPQERSVGSPGGSQGLVGAAPLLALDLCAAPGGKSTLLQSLLPEGSLLICNEPIAKRSQVLAENLKKWMTGLPEEAPQVLVTQNYPVEFGALSGQVDVLLTDVPCSGEGMFRKDEGAIREWSLENVAMCQQRQRDILQDIWHVLKPGGLLIYSTCTFNHLEDEDNARWICSELGGELLMERHFLPGRDRGEGFYVAGIRNLQPSLGAETIQSKTKDKKCLNGGLRVLYDSANTTQPEGTRIDLSYNEALQYLHREALRVDAPRGPVTLCYRGLVLGSGKGVGNRINNLYPDSWRIRTTYTTPFSLLPLL